MNIVAGFPLLSKEGVGVRGIVPDLYLWRLQTDLVGSRVGKIEEFLPSQRRR